MHIRELHSWQLFYSEAKDLQLRLAKEVSTTNCLKECKLIAGVDLSPPDPQGMVNAAMVVINYPEFEVQEIRTFKGKQAFPYIPGLLSFRESPLIINAAKMIQKTPHLILVDGHGLAHPRRFGIASHLGLLFDIPTIGCAKSILCGQYKTIPPAIGSYTWIIDKSETIGAAVRTKQGISPVFISVGNKIDLPTAITWVIKCCHGFRVPEPIRMAHLAAAGKELTSKSHLI